MIMFMVLSFAGCNRKEETPKQSVPAAESAAGSSSGEQQEAESDDVRINKDQKWINVIIRRE